MPDYSPLWYWVKEREKIRKRKERGLPAPWTNDSILAIYRFCNVRREDDRVTVWIRDYIRKPYAEHPLLWLMLCIARQINWPDTLAELIAKKAWPSANDFHPCMIANVLKDRKRRGEKIYTGAYMIAAPSEKGADKQSYIANTVIGEQWVHRFEFGKWFNGTPTLQGTHKLLTRVNGWGPFMAYQAVVDMRFTRLLRNAPDLRWAAAGPGTIRGLNRLHGRPVDFPLPQEQALAEMGAIYRQVWKHTRVDMDFSDVPNILCETDKWLRVKNGEGKPRALYVPGRGS